MHKMKSFFTKKLNIRFLGKHEISFQAGNITKIRETNSLTNEEQVFFRSYELPGVMKILEKWQNNKYHGTIDIDFSNGLIGKPVEHQVLTVNEIG